MDSQDEAERKAILAARRRTVEPIAVNTLFSASGPGSPMLPTPHERIGNMDSPGHSAGFAEAASPSKTARLHARSKSYADPMIQAKRRSLNFPIHSSALSFSGNPSPALTPALTPDTRTPSPTRTGFLTELAAQERRVLELKEELSRAEQHLATLKKQWAHAEAVKKRDDVNRVQQLQPLNTSLANLTLSSLDDDDQDGHSAWLQREMERRKALLNGPKSSQRRIFSGSRHTRALSLLSPDKTAAPSFPQPRDIARGPQSAVTPSLSGRSDLGRAPVAQQARQSVDGRLADLGNALQREMFIRTGKQMATDLKDNLWTFIEDIRQATVGDESEEAQWPSRHAAANVNASSSTREQSSSGAESRAPGVSAKGLARASTVHTTQPARHRKNQPSDASSVDIGGSFWREHGISGTTPQSKRLSKKAIVSKAARAQKVPEDNDGWEWGTPAKAEDSSGSDSEALIGSSPRTSTSSTAPTGLGLGMPRTINSIPEGKTRPGRSEGTQTPVKTDQGLPWPNIVKDLSPSNLKRTASYLMTEWEKSLLPTSAPGTPSSETQGREDAMAALEGRTRPTTKRD